LSQRLHSDKKSISDETNAILQLFSEQLASNIGVVFSIPADLQKRIFLNESEAIGSWRAAMTNQRRRSSEKALSCNLSLIHAAI
jgi:hypothetical protein